MLIQNGTIKKGMFVVSDKAISPARIFEDFRGNPIEEASFSMPVKITGFDKMPEVGAKFKTFKTKSEAEDARDKTNKIDDSDAEDKSVSGTEKDDEKIVIPIIIKADTKGSAEALEKEIMKLSGEKTILNILREEAGGIKEDDIKLVAGVKNPIILGFNADIDASAKEMAERFNVLFFISDIIYKISEWLEEEIKKRELAEPREEIGRASCRERV